MGIGIALGAGAIVIATVLWERNKKGWCKIFLAGSLVLVPGLHRWITTSPINKTLILYNKNDEGWKGGNYGTLQNLLENRILQNDGPYNAKRHFELIPVLSHTVGEIETGVLTITAPHIIQPDPGKWTPRTLNESTTQYRFDIDSVKAGTQFETQLAFKCPDGPMHADEPCAVIGYEFHGKDGQGKRVTLPQTTITLQLAECQIPSRLN